MLKGYSIRYLEIDGIPQLLPEDTDEGDSLYHLWCECTGESQGLCGSDLSYGDITDSDFTTDPEACLVCADLDETHNEICPFGDIV